MPNASVRCTAKASSSENEPLSSSSSMRSRAVSLPFGCCLSSGSPPRCIASYLRLRRRLTSRSEGEGVAAIALSRTAGRHRLATRPRTKLAEDLAQDVAHFSYGGIDRERLSHRGQQVRRSLGRSLDLGKPGLDGFGIAVRPQPRQGFPALLLLFRTDLHDLDRLVVALEAIHADDDAPAVFDRLLESVGAFLDRLLREATFDGGDRPALPVDLFHQAGRPFLQLTGEGLDQVAAPEGIRHRGNVRLVGDDLLGPYRQR